MRRGLTLAVVAGAVMAGTPALALLAPDYYRKARESAPDVVVVKVHAVAGPAHGAGFGDCAVAGTVTEVERGTRYRIGAVLTLSVPCRKAGAQPMPGPVQWTEFDKLRAAPFGRAFLAADGKLALYQYDLLAKAPPAKAH